MTSDSPIVNWAILSPYPSPFARLPGFICFRFLAGAGAWIYLSRCHGVIWLYTRLRATCRRYSIIFCRWPSDAYYFDWATLARRICGVLYILFYDLVLTSETPCYNGLTGVVKDLLAIDRAWRHRRLGCRVHLLVPGVSGARDKIIAGFVLMYGRKKHSVL